MMNCSTFFNDSSADNLTCGYNIPFAVIKFSLGFIALSLHTIVLFLIRSCTAIINSSRTLLISLYIIQIIYFLFLTFYTPLVGMGVIIVEDKIVLQLISFAVIVPVYFNHLFHCIVALDRLVAIQFSKNHDTMFSRNKIRVLICICVMYGIIFATFSFTDCCYIVYHPTRQVWYYPYDKTNKRVIPGLISTYGNAFLAGVIYAMLATYLLKLRSVYVTVSFF